MHKQKFKIKIYGFGDFSNVLLNPHWMAITFNKLGYTVEYFNPPIYKKLSKTHLKIFLEKFLSIFSLRRNKKYDFKISNKYRLFGHFLKKFQDIPNEKEINIIFQPLWINYLHSSIVERSIFFFVDDYSEVSKENNIEDVTNIIKEKYPDRIAVTSKALLEKFPKAKFYPNCIPSTLLDYKPRKKTSKVCFLGTMSDLKIDKDFFLNFIDLNPNYEFKIIGEIQCAIFEKKLYEKQNVTIYGRLNFLESIEKISECEYGLMPFKINSYTHSMHSLKYFEYLSQGLKVISTKLRMFKDIKPLNTVLVEEAINLESLNFQEMGKAEITKFLKQFTYEERAKKILRDF